MKNERAIGDPLPLSLMAAMAAAWLVAVAGGVFIVLWIIHHVRITP